MDENYVMLVFPRSSLGIKKGMVILNTIPVIDADYYNNKDNEGHIWAKIQNEGDKEVFIPKGEAIVQGIFLKYLTTNTDGNINIERTGWDKNNF